MNSYRLLKLFKFSFSHAHLLLTLIVLLGVAGAEKLAEVPKFAYDEPAHPLGSVGASRTWSTKARMKAAQLPNEGKVRFVPDSDYHPTEPFLRGPNKGYLDKFGNEWVKGPSRTQGQPLEWNVQLSTSGQKMLGWASRDGEHINVSIDGRITHR
jgi:filamentous hemagglutinin